MKFSYDLLKCKKKEKENKQHSWCFFIAGFGDFESNVEIRSWLLQLYLTIYYKIYYKSSFPCHSLVKIWLQCRRHKRCRSGGSPGGGHVNPLQNFCLENPRDRGAWWATVHRVAKSQTQLTKWNSSSSRDKVTQSICQFANKIWSKYGKTITYRFWKQILFSPSKL